MQHTHTHIFITPTPQIYDFTLWDPRTVQCLLIYETVKSGLTEADSFKTVVKLI